MSEVQSPGNITRPKSESVYPGIDQVPLEGIAAIGEIFKEGEPKYGRDNWKSSPEDISFDEERIRHAIGHLVKYANGDRSEPHLAKVGWAAVILIWRELQRESSETTATAT